MIRNFSRRGEQNLPILTTFTCIWCVAMFVIMNLNLHASVASMSKWGYYTEYQIYREHKFWALITSAFIHINFLHLFFNLSWMWSLGGALERTIGPARWAVFVLTSAFVSSGLQLASGETGIGLSGVVYAIFGFGWMVRRRFPEFARLVNQRTVQMFIGWGILCIYLTYAGILNVGNFAHAGGLAFGVAVGAWIEYPKWRVPAIAGLVVLSAGAVLSLNWNPMSEDWVAMKAEAADDAHNYPEAIRLYKRALDLGAEPEYAWFNLARIYELQGDKAKLEDAVNQLKAADPEKAKAFEPNPPKEQE